MRELDRELRSRYNRFKLNIEKTNSMFVTETILRTKIGGTIGSGTKKTLLEIRLPQNFAKVDLVIYGLFVT